ncbi:MAG: LptF/LptG family permease [Flavobacteriales bacterium]|nr:LptF/LptG family permease [Flavobacteriales bacterium]MDG1766570.1 LptF/LptG family permease [Flavobacteriales bacterium]
MKKLALLLLKSFIGPFIVTFLIALFILDMQFLWVYVDELMGKGLENMVIIELMIYASARLVNMALPLAILMSSIMTMGALAEHYELTAMKSAGVSLYKILRPLAVTIVIIGVAAFYFSNNVWPIANLKFRTLLYSVSQQRPSLNLDEASFYNGIEGFSIRVGKKNPETGELLDVLIYDHRDASMGSKTVIRAKSGSMKQTDDKRFLLLTLYDGYSFDEQKEERKKRDDRRFPHINNQFEEQVLTIDLSSLDFNQADEDLFKKAYEMMTISQIDVAVDSLVINVDQRIEDLQRFGARNVYLIRDTLDVSPHSPAAKDSLHQNSARFYFNTLGFTQQKRAYEVAKDICRAGQRNIDNVMQDVGAREKLINKHLIEWHRKFFLAFSCIVLFFIGAPLGAIIRKGGMGLPTVWAIAMFLIFYVLTIVGERMVRSGVLEPWQGMWISSLVLTPLAIFLTTKAANDSPIMEADTYRRLFQKLFKSKTNEDPSAMS